MFSKKHEYNFDHDPDHDFRHHSKKVYDEICEHLIVNEYIIKKAREHNVTGDTNNGCYNVMYITNMANIYYSSYNQKYNRIDGPIKTSRCNNNLILNEISIDTIIKYKFKSDHYSKLQKEIIDLNISSKQTILAPTITESDYYKHDESSNDKLNKLLEWCKQVQSSLAIIWLLDNENNNHYHFHNKIINSGPDLTSGRFKRNGKHEQLSFYNFEKGIENRGNPHILYDDDDFKIIITSEHKFMKEKYDELTVSISDLFDNDLLLEQVDKPPAYNFDKSNVVYPIV
jgi:hypothetical protein